MRGCALLLVVACPAARAPASSRAAPNCAVWEDCTHDCVGEWASAVRGGAAKGGGGHGGHKQGAAKRSGRRPRICHTLSAVAERRCPCRCPRPPPLRGSTPCFPARRPAPTTAQFLPPYRARGRPSSWLHLAEWSHAWACCWPGERTRLRRTRCGRSLVWWQRRLQRAPAPKRPRGVPSPQVGNTAAEQGGYNTAAINALLGAAAPAEERKARPRGVVWVWVADASWSLYCAACRQRGPRWTRHNAMRRWRGGLRSLRSKRLGCDALASRAAL